MDWNVRKNSKELLLLLGLCVLVPHGVISGLQMVSGSENWSPVEIETYSCFFLCEWTPFWAMLIGYLGVQKRERFSLMPSLIFSLTLVTFLLRYDRIAVGFSSLLERENLTVLFRIVPLMLVMECSALLKSGENSGNRILAGIAGDRKILRAVFMWTVGILCLPHIICGTSGDAWSKAMVLPFFLIPVPGMLLYEVLRYQKERPPAVWTVGAMLAMMSAALFLASIGPMAKFKLYHLIILGIGYPLVLLVLLVYHVDHWRGSGKKTA